MTIVIEHAKLEDVVSISKIDSEAFPSPWGKDYFEKEIENANRLLIVAKQNKERLAYLNAWTVVDQTEIMRIATLKAARRQGIAKALIEDMIGRQKEHHIKTILLEVSEKNQAAIRLYQSLGFRIDSIRKKYYHDQTNALLMHLDLYLES